MAHTDTYRFTELRYATLMVMSESGSGLLLTSMIKSGPRRRYDGARSVTGLSWR
jgi:hypothetical protein